MLTHMCHFLLLQASRIRKDGSDARAVSGPPGRVQHCCGHERYLYQVSGTKNPAYMISMHEKLVSIQPVPRLRKRNNIYINEER